MKNDNNVEFEILKDIEIIDIVRNDKSIFLYIKSKKLSLEEIFVIVNQRHLDVKNTTRMDAFAEDSNEYIYSIYNITLF